MSANPALDANPVRTPDRQRPRCFRPGRVIQIRFTDFARTPASGLWTLFGASPDEAMRALVHRLGLAAEDLDARAQQLGDVAILRRMPADAPAEFLPGKIMPIAFVEGLAQHEIADSLSWLRRPAKAA